VCGQTEGKVLCNMNDKISKFTRTPDFGQVQAELSHIQPDNVMHMHVRSA